MGEKTLLPPPPHSLFDTSEGPQSVVKPLPQPPAALARASVPVVEDAAPNAEAPAADSKITLTSTPSAIITEDAEAIYVNERRDTTEAPPLVIEAAATAAPPPSADVPPTTIVVSTESAGPVAGVAITWSLDVAPPAPVAAAVCGDETSPTIVTTPGNDPAPSSDASAAPGVEIEAASSSAVTAGVASAAPSGEIEAAPSAAATARVVAESDPAADATLPTVAAAAPRATTAPPPSGRDATLPTVAAAAPRATTATPASGRDATLPTVAAAAPGVTTATPASGRDATLPSVAAAAPGATTATPASGRDATLPSVAAAAPRATTATPASGLPVIPALPATHRRATTPADQVARERGVTPIRVPSVSKRYDAVTPAAVVGTRKLSRRFVLGAFAVAGVCIVATIGAIVWARGAVSEAEQAHVVANTAPDPASVPLPAIVAATAAEPAPLPVPAVAEAAVAEAAVAEARGAASAEPAPLAPSICRVSVTANASGAALSINGVRHGTAPAVVQTPCNANATIELHHPRYEDFRQVLAVDEDVEFAAKLEREKTTLTLWSEPPGAVVSYNGIVLGKTPLVAKVPRYEQATVWFRAPGHAADWRRIMPKEKRKTVSIKLKGVLLAPPS